MTAVALLLDLSNITARAYHSASGKGGSALGLARHRLKSMVQNLINDTDPIRRIAAVESGPGWRHREFPAYKAGRSEKDPEWKTLLAEAPGLLIREFGFEVYESPDHEADDVLATVADGFVPYRVRTVIVSNDRDLLGVALDSGNRAGTFILRHEGGAYRAYGPDEVLNCPKVGVPPVRVPLFKSIAGDASDGIPGVKGLGPVAARRLAREYRSARHLFSNLDHLARGERGKFEAAGFEQLRRDERLATLNCSAPLRRVDA